jgi:hypothetical protein
LRRYTFKYSPEQSKRGIVYRPIAYVSLQSKDGAWYFFYPYVNSGADTSLFTKGDASLLKLNLYEGVYSPMHACMRMDACGASLEEAERAVSRLPKSKGDRSNA